MCLIAYAPKDRTQIPSAHLENAHWRNDDAWGIVFPENGRLRLLRDTTNHAEFRKHWLTVPVKTPVAAHFRYGTSGSMKADMAHPFPILEDEKGVILAMMHNGVLDTGLASPEFKNGMSDTAVLIRDIIQPQLVDHPELVESKGWREAMGNMIGNHNKLLFMRSDGEVFIVNDWQGDYTDGGVWYSNKYSLEAPKVYTQPNTYSGAYNSGSYDAAWDEEYQPAVVGQATAADWKWWHDFLKQGDAPSTDKRYVGAADATPPVLTYEGGEPVVLTGDEAKQELEDRASEPLDRHARATEEEEEEPDQTEELMENLYEMSITEIYNWVAGASLEDITDVIVELSGGGSRETLYG